MLALSIRQPYAELILRGVKTIEYRSRPTKLVGQRFYIYASRKWAGVSPGKWHDAGDSTHGLAPSLNGEGIDDLPRGVIVGSAVISKCVAAGTPTLRVGPHAPGSESRGTFEWHLTGVKRYKRQRRVAPGRQPQPVWFRPW